MTTLTPTQTIQEARADRVFRCSPNSIVTAQIRQDQERDAFERATGAKVDRVTGRILHEKGTR